MMLVVIAHVQRHAIDRTVITECLLIEIVGVMLLNPARAHGMQPNRKQERQYEVKKPGPTAEINDRYIVRDCAREIGGEPSVPHLDRLQSRRACDLKKWKQHQP